MFRQLDDHVLVAGQIGAEDVAQAAALGVTAIVNNRPDGEAPDQPTSAEIAAKARAAGLDYWHIPVAGGLAPAQVEQMARVLETSEGKVLAFCKSGTRSVYLWALARARAGENGEALFSKAAAAGYDLTPLRGYLG